MNKKARHNIGIIGLGQMGGSFAMVLKPVKHFRAVIGYDVKSSLVMHAINDGIIDKTADSEDDLIEKSQVVVLAVPISVILAILERHRHTLSTKTLVVDLGGVRGSIQRTSARLKMKNHVGIHPICGTAHKGRSAWNGSLYKGASCFVFSNKLTNDNSIRRARKLIRLVGGCSVSIDHRKHDYAFAVTSGIPHILAFSLMKVRTDSRGIPIELEGPSFTGATRVSASDSIMTGEMLYHNRDNLLKAVSRLEKNINKIKKLLSSDDSTKLAQTLESYGQSS
ncbi:MAG: prephenate dehydrogenase [candidate division Zixibacteria bacterium]